MKAKNLLKSKQIDPWKSILTITAEEALSNLINAAKEFDTEVDFSKFTKEELETVLSVYADAMIDYHPDDFHQERITFIKNADIVTKYGISHEDLNRMDFA